MRLRDRIARFMWGRYGIDQLYYGLFVLYVILLFSGYIFSFIGILRNIFTVLSLAVLVFMFFRVFSKNVAKRRKENEMFLKIKKPIGNFFVLQKNKIRDFRKFVYKKCPSCKATLRLPRKKGEHSVVCPKCKNRFNVKNLF